jgi:hypothetical protein
MDKTGMKKTGGGWRVVQVKARSSSFVTIQATRIIPGRDSWPGEPFGMHVSRRGCRRPDVDLGA